MKKRVNNVEAVSKKYINNLVEFSKMDLKKVYKKLNTDIEGLTIDQVEKRRKKWGIKSSRT